MSDDKTIAEKLMAQTDQSLLKDACFDECDMFLHDDREELELWLFSDDSGICLDHRDKLWIDLEKVSCRPKIDAVWRNKTKH